MINRIAALSVSLLGLGMSSALGSSGTVIVQPVAKPAGSINVFIRGDAADALYGLFKTTLPPERLPQGTLFTGLNITCAQTANGGAAPTSACSYHQDGDGLTSEDTPTFDPSATSTSGTATATRYSDVGLILIRVTGAAADAMSRALKGAPDSDGKKAAKNIVCEAQAGASACSYLTSERGLAEPPRPLGKPAAKQEGPVARSTIQAAAARGPASMSSPRPLSISSRVMTLEAELGVFGQEGSRQPPSVTDEPFESILARLAPGKDMVMRRQRQLLAERYDLSNRPASGVTMTRGKPVQAGIRAKLALGLTWERLASMTPDEIREKDLFPQGFLRLPHPNHPEGGMLFPHFHIEEILRQEGRDLNRFDLEFDLPDHFLAEFPAPIFLTTHPELGDVSQGKLVTRKNFYELFSKILNPKQLDGLRLLTTPFAQQQFNHTNDRRSVEAHIGVSCLDCHANGHTNNGTHLVGDIRPQENRRRIDTPSLRGVRVQRLFGSQRALKTIEDFTEFEQRAAYFDGDPAAAAKKGLNPLDRGSQVQDMAEFQELLDFPPAPKLDGITGRLVTARATPSELRGETLFNGKAQCMTCHAPPFYTDNLMHDLHVERFFRPKMINGVMTLGDGPIKTFPLRGIKDSPPYLNDGRLLTLEDTVEFFNLVLETKLNATEKGDLVSFLRTL